MGAQVHVAETRYEMGRSAKEAGTTPLRYLDHLGLVDSHLTAVDCIHMDQANYGLLQIVPVHDIINRLVCCAKGEDLDTTIINGRIVMRHCELATRDEEKSLELAQEWGYSPAPAQPAKRALPEGQLTAYCHRRVWRVEVENQPQGPPTTYSLQRSWAVEGTKARTRRWRFAVSQPLEQLIDTCAPERMPDRLPNHVNYTRDAGPYPVGTPEVRPTTPEEISGILSVANEYVTPVFICARSTASIGIPKTGEQRIDERKNLIDPGNRCRQCLDSSAVGQAHRCPAYEVTLGFVTHPLQGEVPVEPLYSGLDRPDAIGQNGAAMARGYEMGRRLALALLPEAAMQ